MAISIDWGTLVINVPLSYLTLSSGSVYTMDVDQFRLDLKALEATSEGMAFPRTHNHNTTVTLSGITYARTVEIINGYTVTFEPGAYAVVFGGANHNIIDVMNFNGVSALGNNSAGLIDAETMAALISEVHIALGLALGNAATVTPSGLTTALGDIDVEFTGDGVSSTTMTRQP